MLVNSNYRYGGGGIGSSLIIEGYYNNSKFYQDDSFTIEIDGESGKLYVDISTNKAYRWDGSIFTVFNADTLDGLHASDFCNANSPRITGAIRVNPNTEGNFSEGIRIANATNGYSDIVLGAEGDVGITSTGIWIGKTNTNEFIISRGLAGDTSNGSLRLDTSGNWYVNGPNQLIHSGNISSQSVANAVTASQVVGSSSKVRLYEDNEGGNLRLVAPDGVHSMEMDLYNNEGFRMYFGDETQLYFPVDYNFSTGKFNINGNADTVDGKHASDFIPISGGTLTGSIITPANDSMGIIPATDNYGQIGSNDKKFFRMYATTFYGSLSGNASTATTATRLSTTAGSAIKPVYFSNGKPIACTYTLEKSVPSNAVFTDTTYSAATSSANGLMSSSDKSKLDGISAGANKTTVDSALSSTSANPVQNNVITAALASKSDSSHTHSSVNYATNAGNADTVDNMHAWNLTTLSANGDSHGTTYPMYCRFNVLGDSRFYIGVGNGYERKVAVGFAETSSIAYNASHADIATESSTTGAVRSVIIGTVEAAFSTILDWANATTGSLRAACIIGGNGFPSDAPVSDEAMLRLESDKDGARKIITWTRFGSGEPVIYQRCIFNGSWLDVWRKVK